MPLTCSAPAPIEVTAAMGRGAAFCSGRSGTKVFDSSSRKAVGERPFFFFFPPFLFSRSGLGVWAWVCSSSILGLFGGYLE